MTPAEFATAMHEIDKDIDTEAKHVNADELMCIVLLELGYSEGVSIFRHMDKYYA